MACRCSGGRAALTRTTLRPSSPRPRAADDHATTVALAYTGAARLSLRGPFSGRIYRVGPQTPRLEADSRDVEALLRTGFFARPPQ